MNQLIKGKVLITADVHIGDYANYNFTYRSRLKQFEKLAYRFIEICKANNCTEVWILGDLVDKPNSRPYILHEASKFVQILLDAGLIVRYTLGNHDLDSKSQELDYTDAQITIFSHENLIYMDKKVLECNGHKYAFMNWRPEQDLEWLPEKVDVLFGHYTKSELFGQDIDETKFDLMIHGDIHNSQVIGKFVSVCNPVQKDMSSEKDGKVIIFDPMTSEWKRELTDPDHTRFLQIEYTNERSKEGFNGELQYFIYRPEIEVVSTQDKVEAFTWNDIDDLINTTCKENNLEDIHSQIISQCEAFTEIDFNFQLNSLKIHGYRSIEDLELVFDQGDRIALLGANGTGKSSIIRALQGAFGKNSELKYEQSEFTDDQLIVVSLTYQGSVYEITKGSRWGLTIDGQEQPYSGIRDFESDLVIKLPFLGYLDLLFLNSNISNLSNKFSPTQRINLISKFYRLDRIQAYHNTAHKIYQEINRELITLTGERNVQIGIRDHIQSQVTELESLNLDPIDTYREKLNEYRKLRDDHQQYQLWLKDYQNQLDLKSSAESRIASYKSGLSFNIESGKKDLQDIKDENIKLNEAYQLTYKRSIEFENLIKSLNEIESSGKLTRSKLDILNKGRCPECDAPLSAGKSKQLVDQYNSELDSLGKRWDSVMTEIDKHPKKLDSKEYYMTALKKMKETYDNNLKSIELLENKISNYESIKSKLSVEETNLKQVLDRISDMESTRPDKVQLPLELYQLETEATTNINRCDDLVRRNLELTAQNELVIKLDEDIKLTTDKLDRYNHYIELTSMTGIIYEEILRKLADRFSTTEVKYEVESGVYRGSRYINFNSYYLSRGTYRLYESCSDGQKTVCDLDFIEKLFTVNIGLLVLDEYLKHLDDTNFAKVCDILTGMNVNTVILSTHDDNLTAYTRRILLSLDEVGRTVANSI